MLPTPNPSDNKKSTLNRLIDSFQSLKLCTKHFHHSLSHSQAHTQHHPTASATPSASASVTQPSSPPTTTPASASNPSITFPVPKPFKHPSQSVLGQSATAKLNLNLNPSLTSPPPSVVRPKPSQRLSLQKKPLTEIPSILVDHRNRPKTSTTPSTLTSSTTASPTTTTTVTRCCGTTREGKPCSRKPMKTISPSPGQPPINLTQKLDHLDLILLSSSPSSHSESPVPRFCFQHYQKVNVQSGAFFGKSIWIEYSDWFASELPDDVKITLKTEMSKQPSEKDRNEDGYLYCHEMRPIRGKRGVGKSPGTYIKVGRSTRPVARLGDWSKQCPSRTPIVRGFFPEYSSSVGNNNNNQQATCYLDGIQTVSPRGIRFHRKWERLVLVELAGWAILQRQGNPKLPCPDCLKVHLELFELDLGSYERLVKPLILKWQKWCQFAYL